MEEDFISSWVRTVKEVNPLKQGLKLNKGWLIAGFLLVKEVNPLKQGLKQRSFLNAVRNLIS